MELTSMEPELKFIREFSRSEPLKSNRPGWKVVREYLPRTERLKLRSAYLLPFRSSTVPVKNEARAMCTAIIKQAAATIRICVVFLFTIVKLVFFRLFNKSQSFLFVFEAARLKARAVSCVPNNDRLI